MNREDFLREQVTVQYKYYYKGDSQLYTGTWVTTRASGETQFGYEGAVKDMLEESLECEIEVVGTVID